MLIPIQIIPPFPCFSWSPFNQCLLVMVPFWIQYNALDPNFGIARRKLSATCVAAFNPDPYLCSQGSLTPTRWWVLSHVLMAEKEGGLVDLHKSRLLSCWCLDLGARRHCKRSTLYHTCYRNLTPPSKECQQFWLVKNESSSHSCRLSLRLIPVYAFCIIDGKTRRMTVVDLRY